MCDDHFKTNQALSSGDFKRDQAFETMIDDSLRSTNRSYPNDLSPVETTFINSTESLNTNDLDFSVFSDIEPSINTLHPEIFALTENIIDQDLDECIFQKQQSSQISDIEHNNPISQSINIENDEETRSAIDSCSENDEAVIIFEFSNALWQRQQHRRLILNLQTTILEKFMEKY
ncbi:hypothetical protein NBO_837g0001, partial [Nosema bombycis CQ1]